MVYAVRVACHIYLDIHMDIHLDIYLDIHLNIHLNIHLDIYLVILLNVHLNIHLDIHLNVHLHLSSPYLRLTSPLTASRHPLHYLAPQSVSAIRVHSLLFPSSSTVNLRS